MNYKNTPRKQACHLSTPVRLGVAAVAACFISTPVLSNPVNPTVVNGAASFNQAGNVLTVTNSNGAIINWQKFSIQSGETTHFAQTSASSTVLNRVLSDPTAIYGTLSSNGRVWLVNPAGVMVGPGGRVDVAGFVASTLNIRNQDFLAGRNVFINDGNAGNVVNQGEIRTPAGGSVYLMGSNVSNEGIITTPKGETILAAGATVTLVDSATPGVTVDITGAEGNATNLGTITAEAGRIGIAGVIVRNSGTVNASSVVSEGGRIFLRASQDAYVDGNGRIVTTGTRGGSVEVLGNRVAVMDNAEIDASGTGDTNAGGGGILVGGDYQGKNSAIQNASVTYFGPSASLKADAGKVGDGGTVIVWADDTTRAYGNISVRGGADGGDGGFVEVSGHRYLDFHAHTDRSAPKGKAGMLLLDPADITIGTTNNYGGGVFSGGLFAGADVAGGSYLSWGTISGELALGSIAITTTGSGGSGDIIIATNSPDLDSLWDLGLLAHRNINTNANTVTNTGGGSIYLVAGWDGNTVTPGITGTVGSITGGGNFTTNGGNFGAVAADSIALGDVNTDAWSNESKGGDVFIRADSGTMSVRSISARGAWGGGYGGNVELWAKSDLTVGTGGINATGGSGYSGWYAYGGAGGDGGKVEITSLIGKIQVDGNIITDGGSGGDGDSGGYTGGTGGKGGDITLTSGSFISLVAGKTIRSVGGQGGDGGEGSGGTGGTGGSGGGGGIIKLDSGSYISLGANSQILAKGGDGGEGGWGGYGGSVGYQGGIGGAGGDGGTIELKAAAGKIELANNAALDASGGIGGTGGEGASYAFGYYGGGLVDNGGTGGMGGMGGGHGSIVLEATAGNITLGSNVGINASGGMGGTGGTGGYGYYSSGNGGMGGMGGYGGMIELTTVGSGNIEILGSNVVINASGGMGGTGGTGGYGYYYDGGAGGMGGTGGTGGSIVMLTPAAGSITLGANISLDASGGEGGRGGDGGYAYAYYSYGYSGNGGMGGTGGAGGYVRLDSGTGGISMISGGNILARGGNGGMGGLGGDGGEGGYAGMQGLGGDGGNNWDGGIELISDGVITLTSGTLDAGGGHGGGYWFGGNGGHGGNGGYVYVAGESIVANGASFLARGGNASNGDAYAEYSGGNGGNGGYVGLVAGGENSIALTNSSIVDVGGGSGGPGADSVFIDGFGPASTTGGGNGGNGGYAYAYSAGALSLASSSILANGGGGGQGGNDLTGYSIGGNGGDGGNGGQIVMVGSSVAMSGGSSVQANGGWGGWGGNGFGNSAEYTMTDRLGVEICGPGTTPCNGTQTVDSTGIPLFFSPVNGSGPATVGGSGGAGGSVYGGVAIFMNATAGGISMSSDSTVYASPGGGGQGGSGWYGGATAFYYPSYPSSYVQQIWWDGISSDFTDWSTGGLPGTPGIVSLNATGSISLGSVEAWDGTVNVAAGGAIIDSNGSGVTNIRAQNATLTSIYGGAAGELAISTGTEVYGNLVATVSGGAYGGIDIANSSWDQPASVTLADNATSGSAIFRQVFYNPTSTLYGAGISLSAPSGGFVGLSSNRDLTINGGTFSVAGGGGFIGFAANNGILNIDSAVAGGTNSVELSAGTLNISASVSGDNISLDGSTTNIFAMTTATGDLSAGSGVMNINAQMTAGGNLQLGGTAININSGGNVSAGNNVALVTPLIGGTINLAYGGGVTAQGMAGTPSTINGIPYTGIAFVAQNLNGDSGGYLDAQGLTGNISGLVSGGVTLKNGAYFAAGDDIELVLAGSGSTVSLSSGAHFLSDYATGLPGTIYLDFLTRSSGGIMIDGAATTTSLPGGSGFFVVDDYTPAVKGTSLMITYASNVTAVDPCTSSPDLCNPPSPVTDPVIVGDPCATSPDSTQCKAKLAEKKKKEKDSFGDEDEEEDDSSHKKVAQCSV